MRIHKETPVNVEIVSVLLDAAKKNVQGQTISGLIHEEMNLCRSIVGGLPFNPERFTKKQKSISESFLPSTRTVVWVNKQQFTSFKASLLEQANEQFELTLAKITNRYALECALWSALRRKSVHFESLYFSDLELSRHLDKEIIVKNAILAVSNEIGRLPTSREYENYRKEFGGPSLSYIKKHCGSFNAAKSICDLSE